MSPAEQVNAGVTPEMVRLSVGVEHIDDILADLDQALASAAALASHSDALGSQSAALATQSAALIEPV